MTNGAKRRLRLDGEALASRTAVGTNPETHVASRSELGSNGADVLAAKPRFNARCPLGDGHAGSNDPCHELVDLDHYQSPRSHRRPRPGNAPRIRSADSLRTAG